MNRDDIRDRLSFYRDLGVKDIYKRAVKQGKTARAGSVDTADTAPGKAPGPAHGASPPIPVIEAVLLKDAPLPPLQPPGDTLLKIIEDMGDCHRCGLSQARNKIVFGSGNEQARLVFVGEGPGADEDAQGFPFVGRAGQLLTQMIDNTTSKEGIPIRRADVYICNVVKCRPPENRTPLPDEMEICGQFLFRQLMAIRPKAICALGSTAAKALLATKEGVTRLRGRWHKWHDIPVIVTFHPSYLLRPYNQDAKREAWEDLKKVLHFVYD
jgi:DNA polymerase